jgi:hypothetical protein
MVRATQVFKKCQMFSGMNDIQLDRLAAITEDKECIAGTVFFREGRS